MALGVYQERQLLQQSVDNQLPTDKYYISRIDEATDPKYYGFVRGGYWYIMKSTLSGGVTSYTYYAEKLENQNFSRFLVVWAARAATTFVEAAAVKIF